MKISKKPFSLDPNLANLKDNITSHSKQTNWALVSKELKVILILLLKSITLIFIKIEIWDQDRFRKKSENNRRKDSIDLWNIGKAIRFWQ